MKKLTTENFIIRCNEKHNNKYDYSLSIYQSANLKIKIICPEHGEFEQRASHHLKGSNCPKCVTIENKITNSKFIEKAKIIHGDKYDYSLVNYKLSNLKVKIICKIHGEFEQKPNSHIMGKGCRDCQYTNNSIIFRGSQEKFIENAISKHGDKYNYSLVNYRNSKTPIKIICPNHGAFEQIPYYHLNGNGCPKCASELIGFKSRLVIGTFIDKANEKHNNKYDYSLTNYITGVNKIKIICPIHGEFEQRAQSHLMYGCYSCGKFNIKQNILYESLLNKLPNISIIPESRPNWLKSTNLKSHLSLDIYLPDYNIGIEYQGKQHFHPIKFFDGEKGFQLTQERDERDERDERKRLLCEANGCKLFYFTYTPKDVPADYTHKVYSDEQELLNEIRNSF